MFPRLKVDWLKQVTGEGHFTLATWPTLPIEEFSCHFSIQD